MTGTVVNFPAPVPGEEIQVEPPAQGARPPGDVQIVDFPFILKQFPGIAWTPQQEDELAYRLKQDASGVYGAFQLLWVGFLLGTATGMGPANDLIGPPEADGRREIVTNKAAMEMLALLGMWMRDTVQEVPSA